MKYNGTRCHKKVEMINRFYFRAARAKACALSMARYQDEGNFSGDAHKSLARGVGYMGIVYPKKWKRSIWWHLAIITSEESLTQYRDAVNAAITEKNIQAVSNDNTLKRIGFPADQKSMEALFDERREILLN